MKFSAGIIALVLGLSGCATTSGGGDKIHYVVIQTEPTAAFVSFADGDNCETPCRIGVIDSVDLTIARTGYKALRTTLTRKTPKKLMVSLEPVVVDTELEKVDLPDLQ